MRVGATQLLATKQRLHGERSRAAKPNEVSLDGKAHAGANGIVRAGANGIPCAGANGIPCAGANGIADASDCVRANKGAY